ncbi:MAG: HAMP domain-containing sensor histidine kinase [Actinomycetes bacterium]
MFASLSSRAALLTGAIAAVAVLIAGAVALPLIRGAAEAQARTSLSSQADLVRDIATRPDDFDFDNGPSAPADAHRTLIGIVNYLRAQGVAVEAVIPGQHVPNVFNMHQIRELASGHAVSSRNCDARQCVLIEARPVGVGTGIALIQPVSVVSSVTSTAIARIALALVIGFVVAVAIGLFAARRLARPLSKAAQVAHQLSLGERSVRLTPVGPTEVAEIAIALNGLAEQLSYSEDRQREFFLSISHELRTPLTAVQGFAEAMAEGLVPAKDVERIGGIMVNESLRLDHLVSDLLDLARAGAVDFPLTMLEVNLNDLLEEAASVWASRASKEGVELRTEIPQRDIIVTTDPIRVRQIIDNLAENALRVTPSAAPIVFTLREPAIIEVRDGGPGLMPDDINVAFEPGALYERYRGVRKVGTGFGLAIVGRLSSRLGAVATAGVAPEGGAAFTIDFGGCIDPVN